MSASRLELTERLRRENRWDEASEFRETARADFRSKGMGRQEAKQAAWLAMAKAFPPLPVAETAADPASTNVRVQGLGDIPESWGELPSNTSLQAELSWVQANRLAVITETASGATVVHLDRAEEPAPSRSAIGWLETSIRAYSKYCDIVARSLKDEIDEQQNIKRERMAIAEIRELLAEMHQD